MIILFLFIFSFYYTDKVVQILREKDPLMKKIRESEEKFKIDPVEAVINDSTLIVGRKGRKIDLEKSYKNMKEYGAYNESLTVEEDTFPMIRVDHHYDKYLVGGNPTIKRVSLVFIGDEEIPNMIQILDKKHTIGTFFIDGTFLEKNVTLLRRNKIHEFELLSYKGEYNESFFKTSLSYLESIRGEKAKYCYVEKENDRILNLCKSLKLHTVMPSYVFRDNIYQGIKNQLTNGAILAIYSSSSIERELPIIISYIKEKGYKIVSLEELLSE